MSKLLEHPKLVLTEVQGPVYIVPSEHSSMGVQHKSDVFLAVIFISLCLFPTALGARPKGRITLLPKQKLQPIFPSSGGFTAKPTVRIRAGALVTIFAADKKTIILSGSTTANCPTKEIFEEKQVFSTGPMARYGPRYLCTYKDSLFVAISESTISGYYCTALSSNSGCLRESLWWSIWLNWNSNLKSMGVTADDIRYNRLVTLTEKEYSNLVRLFWRVYYDGKLPAESVAVHGLHGHSTPKRFITAPRVSRGGGAFGAPIWHGREDPCVADTLDILFKWKNKIPRPCKPITYDNSGFYVSNPDLLSSTVLGPECDHTCGFRYYYGSRSKGQIIAFRPATSKLNNRNSIEGAILDHA